jgi:stress-induced morphogen
MADLAEVRKLIEKALPGAEVEVIDETGTADHLRATVRAEQFRGLSRLEQHRLVKAAVQERMDDGSIHALSVKTSLPEAEAGDADSVTSSETGTT